MLNLETFSWTDEKLLGLSHLATLNNPSTVQVNKPIVHFKNLQSETTQPPPNKGLFSKLNSLSQITPKFGPELHPSKISNKTSAQKNSNFYHFK